MERPKVFVSLICTVNNVCCTVFAGANVKSCTFNFFFIKSYALPMSSSGDINKSGWIDGWKCCDDPGVFSSSRLKASSTLSSGETNASSMN